jgi:zinc/manganese transport system ATP-binding protein
VLSGLYGSRVEVIRANGRLIVVGLPEGATHHHEDAHSVAGEVG